MKINQFTFWLRGYIDAVKGTNISAEKIIADIEEKLKEVKEEEQEYVITIVEKIIETTPYLPPYNPCIPTVVMYGCQTAPYTTAPYTTTTKSDSK